MNKPENPEIPRKATHSELSDLLQNLDEWADHFRQTQHGAVLTILRARKIISDQSDRIGELFEAVETLGLDRNDARAIAERFRGYVLALDPDVTLPLFVPWDSLPAVRE